jgi:hypothetical protein
VAKSRAPEVVTLSPTQLEELLAKLAGLLPAEIYQLVAKSLRTLHWVMGVIEAKETSLSRLQRLIFGAKTEKTAICCRKATPPRTPPSLKPKATGAKPPRIIREPSTCQCLTPSFTWETSVPSASRANSTCLKPQPGSCALCSVPRSFRELSPIDFRMDRGGVRRCWVVVSSS